MPTGPIIGPVPDCAKSCLLGRDLQGCGAEDVSCICRNQNLIADYSCCLSQSCGSSYELSSIIAIGRALCACYGYFGLPTSAGCSAPVYSIGPSPTAANGLVTPTASTCSGILGSITTQFVTVTATTTTGGSTQTVGGPTATVTTTALPNCPFANGQVYVDALGFSYLIICNTAYTGILLETISIAAIDTQPRLSDCIAACDAYNLQNSATTQCEGVSLDSNVSTGNCALIGGEITAVDRVGVYSGRVLRAVVGPGGTTIVTGGGSATNVALPASTNTVTTTTISISVRTTTAMVTSGGTGAGTGAGGVVTISATASTTTVTTTEQSTVTGPTVTTNGGTITQSGPTVTATGPGGTNGGTVTLSLGSGTATVSRTTTTTVVSYVLPSSPSQSRSSVSVCRTTATNYLRGSLPGKRSFLDYDRKLAGEDLFPRPGAVAAL